MEAAHRKFAKVAQLLPQNIPNAAPLATLGWLTLNSYIAIQRIMFMWRILCLPRSNLTKQIMIYRLNKFMSNSVVDKVASPLYITYKIVQNHGLENVVIGKH